MTKTTTSPSKPPTQLRDFSDAMHAHIRKTMLIGFLVVISPPPVLIAGAAARTWLGQLPSPAGTVVPRAIAVAAVTAVLIGLVRAYRKDPVKRVDWSTAGPYEQQVTADLPPVTRGILAAAQRTVRARVPAATRVHLYVMGPNPAHEESCTVDSGGCKCALFRLTAAFGPNRRRPMLIIGQRLLDTPDQLKFCLTHEAHHARRASRTMHMLLGVPLVAGWLALALAVPPRWLLVVAPMALLITNGMRWADELLGDVVGIRAVGASTALEYWARVREACPPRPTGLRRLLGLVLLPLLPHPPFSVRVALAKRMLRRAN